MDFFKRMIRKINNHFLLRNIVLAVCGVIVFVFVTSVLLNLFTRHGQQHEVPDMIGMPVDQTSDLTSGADLEIVVIDSLFVPGEKPGAILDQNPKATARVKSGRKVFVVINATKPKTAIIPYVTGYSLRQAKNILESKGFTIERLVYQSDMATNNVIGQSYDNHEIRQGGTLSAPMGSGVVLRVGRSESTALPMVPKVVGLTLREAKSRLWEVGLNVGQVRRDQDVTDRNEDQAKVYIQTPGQQTRIDYGARIDLQLSANEQKIAENSKKSDAQARKQPIEPEVEVTDAELEELLKE